MHAMQKSLMHKVCLINRIIFLGIFLLIVFPNSSHCWLFFPNSSHCWLFFYTLFIVFPNSSPTCPWPDTVTSAPQVELWMGITLFLSLCCNIKYLTNLKKVKVIYRNVNKILPYKSYQDLERTAKNWYNQLDVDQAPIFGRVLSKGFFPIRASSFNNSFVIAIVSLKGMFGG